MGKERGEEQEEDEEKKMRRDDKQGKRRIRRRKRTRTRRTRRRAFQYSLPKPLDTNVALDSDMSLKQSVRTKSCSVTAESELSPDDIVLIKGNGPPLVPSFCQSIYNISKTFT